MQPTPDHTDNGRIHNLDELKANTEQPCHVFGTYVWIDPHKEAREDVSLPAGGHQAAVRLEDGTLVYLQPTWEATAARPEEELTTYRDKAVVVTGTLLNACPPPPDHRAYVQGPCMAGPISITDRSTWDAMHGGKLDWDNLDPG